MLKRLRGMWMICACSLLLISTNVYAADNTDQEKARILEIYDLLTQHHLSGTDATTIENGAIQGMLDSLNDPFTTYFTDQEFKDFQSNLQGTYAGIGVLLEERDGELFVNEVFDGSPASKAGITEGDQILSFDGKAVKGVPIDTILADVKGEEGTSLKVKYLHMGQTHEVELVRQQIDLPVVKSELLFNKLGYIHLGVFNNEAADTFATELTKLKQKNMQGLIIDLRDNPGGMLSAAAKLVSQFVKDGPMVYIKDRDGIVDQINVEQGQDWNIPIVVLVNENSASAAEIMTADLKDYGKATIIGEKTYGKGTVQDVIPLKSGGVLKMTIDEYVPPKHETINHVGITPDILVKNPDEQLLAAILYLTDQNTLTLQKNGSVLVNSKNLGANSIAAIRNKGNWYLSTRVLSYLFHGKLGYDAANDQVTLELGGKGHSFSLKGDPNIRIRNGTSYLSLFEVLKDYPFMQADSHSGDVILHGQE
jgi:carboxyl-terminal processing protease